MKSSTSKFLGALAGALSVAVAGTMLTSAASPKFYADDPVWIERDTQDASSIKPLEVDLFVDLTTNIVAGQETPVARRAANVNTVDEVPNSSWFTNRLGYRQMSPEEIAKGPNTTNGPAAGAWTITSSKSDGVTPGFTVKDSTGQRWFLKFDPPGYRAMSTGTEVAVTKLMWALGYNVPENHIAYLQREQLVIGEGAKFTPPGRNPRPMRNSDIDNLLKRANREQDGSYRVVASKALPGKPVGPRAVRRHPAGRSERHRGAPGSARAAGLRRVRRVAEPRRRQGDQFARRARIRERQVLRPSLSDRLRLGAWEWGSRAGGLLGGFRVSGGAARRRQADGEPGDQRAEVADGAVLRIARHRPPAAPQRRFQSGPLEAARSQPGVPARPIG